MFEPGRSCSSLSCDATNMNIELDPKLFGLDDPSSAVWASTAQPALSTSEDSYNKLVYNEPLGSEGMSVTLSEEEDKVVAQVWLAISGADRQRSGGLMATETDLGGDLQVYSGNVGIQVTFTCEYPSKVTLVEGDPRITLIKQ